MKFFNKTKDQEIAVNVGDRILRRVVIPQERKWWDDRDSLRFRTYILVESIVKEISPSGDYYCFSENGKDVWVDKRKLYVVEVLKGEHQ